MPKSANDGDYCEEVMAVFRMISNKDRVWWGMPGDFRQRIRPELWCVFCRKTEHECVLLFRPDNSFSSFQFRRLLLLALLTRAILMPIQIWSDPIWWQFFGDTFPEMIFASAWTLLVSFFVQLVGLATGTGTNTSPSIVIQATAYVVYAVLITTQIWNDVATILLYALLSCIYAALFGTVIYFGPRLLSLLQTMHTTNGTASSNISTTSLVGSGSSSGNANLVSGVNGIRTNPHFGVLLRVSLCAVVTIALFAGHTVGYARLVVAPPRDVYWWINYGAMELLPAVVLLVLMHPQQHGRGGRRKNGGIASGDDADEDQHHAGTPVSSGAVKGLRRTDSTSSAASGNKRSTTPNHHHQSLAPTQPLSQEVKYQSFPI